MMIVDVDDAPVCDVCLVLGCPPFTNARAPSRLLDERCATAAALHREHRACRLLVSGTPVEAAAMHARVTALGVDESFIDVDDGATRTLENLRRARDRFGLTRGLVVTQRFHLPRTLRLAGALGLSLVGVVAPGPPPSTTTLLRERLADVRAHIEVVRLRRS
jgi:vancomycin permeability regulator SanA